MITVDVDPAPAPVNTTRFTNHHRSEQSPCARSSAIPTIAGQGERRRLLISQLRHHGRFYAAEIDQGNGGPVRSVHKSSPPAMTYLDGHLVARFFLIPDANERKMSTTAANAVLTVVN